MGALAGADRGNVQVDRLITGQTVLQKIAGNAFGWVLVEGHGMAPLGKVMERLGEGEIVGYQVTLRGARMWDFLEKLIHIALPRTRDFRGLNATAIDEMGNMTIGIKEHSIFPEASEEDLKDVFGLAITIVTTAGSKKEAEAFFRHLGVPLKAAA